VPPLSARRGAVSDVVVMVAISEILVLDFVDLEPTRYVGELNTITTFFAWGSDNGDINSRERGAPYHKS
jgi:hypothetical protein